MAAALVEIKGLSEMQPLFQEFCKIKGLSDGDFFRPVDYLLWNNGLTLEQQLQIVRKYIPGFKMKSCNL